MKKIILDTDIGSDCDDAGALAVLHNLRREKKCDILAIVRSRADIYGGCTIKAINEWFEAGDIPVGQFEAKDFLASEAELVYTKNIGEKYLKNSPGIEFENAVRLYRRILSENSGVTIICIGFLNNIAELINSQPDDISEYTGLELVEKSVCKIYSMAGDFSGKEIIAEFNVRMDVKSAHVVTEKMPVPIVYLGWEIGNVVKCGHTLWQYNNEYPVKQAYEYYGMKYDLIEENGTYNREGWDPLLTYYAVTDDCSFMHESEQKEITFDKDGFTQIKDGGKDTYLILDDKEKAEQLLEKYIKA